MARLSIRSGSSSSWTMAVLHTVLSLLGGGGQLVSNNNNGGGVLVVAQTPLCACSPSSYTLTLDFSLTCPPVNIIRNRGIAATFCQIGPIGDAGSDSIDLVPVSVGYVDILELGPSFRILTATNITGPLVEGDTINYNSSAANRQAQSNTEVVKTLQLNIVAYNAGGQPIANFLALSFSNYCDGLPSLIQGESAGWAQFTKLDPPIEGACQVAASPINVLTTASTTSPTNKPTHAPFLFLFLFLFLLTYY